MLYEHLFKNIVLVFNTERLFAIEIEIIEEMVLVMFDKCPVIGKENYNNRSNLCEKNIDVG